MRLIKTILGWGLRPQPHLLEEGNHIILGEAVEYQQDTCGCHDPAAPWKGWTPKLGELWEIVSGEWDEGALVTLFAWRSPLWGTRFLCLIEKPGHWAQLSEMSKVKVAEIGSTLKTKTNDSSPSRSLSHPRSQHRPPQR